MGYPLAGSDWDLKPFDVKVVVNGDLVGEFGVLCGSAGVYCAGSTVDMALCPSQPQPGFRAAITDDFCCGSKSSWCTYEGGIVPVKKCGSEARDVLYFFMYVVHEEGKKGVG